MVAEEVPISCLLNAKENVAAVILCTVNRKFFMSVKVGSGSELNLSVSTTYFLLKYEYTTLD
jgi:hypothetical protein